MSDHYLDIINARLVGYQGLYRICIHQNKISAVDLMESIEIPVPKPSLQLLDVKGDWLSLGGVDLQINGALGLAFPDLTVGDGKKLQQICQFLWHEGVDGFVPTIVTTSVANIQRSLQTIAEFIQTANGSVQPTAQILGVHLEGPFLNPEKRGAHPAEFLRPLTIDQIQRVLGDYAPVVRIITLAPELDPSGEAIAYLRSLGITVSLGHSQATAAQAEVAFARGASMVTHAFNAMPGLHHREPGLIGAAILNPEVYCGLIADGVHVSPLMVKLLLRACRDDLNLHTPQGLFLVSDALAPLGLPDGTYPWDTREITVNQGTARLPDGTLAGTTRSLLVGAQNLVRWGVCSVETAVTLATLAPRRAIGLSEFLVGQPAHLLRWQVDRESQKLIWQRL